MDEASDDELMNIVNDMGTPTTDDDMNTDISNIDQIVESEVERQLQGHDAAVGDTHNAPSSDDRDYPVVALFDSGT